MSNNSVSRSFELKEWTLLGTSKLGIEGITVDKVLFTFGSIPQQILLNQDGPATEIEGSNLKLSEEIEVD